MKYLRSHRARFEFHSLMSARFEFSVFIVQWDIIFDDTSSTRFIFFIYSTETKRSFVIAYIAPCTFIVEISWSFHIKQSSSLTHIDTSTRNKAPAAKSPSTIQERREAATKQKKLLTKKLAFQYLIINLEIDCCSVFVLSASI